LRHWFGKEPAVIGAVDVAAVLDAQHDYLAWLVPQAVEHAVRAASGGPDPGQVAEQWRADPSRLLHERGREKVDDRPLRAAGLVRGDEEGIRLLEEASGVLRSSPAKLDYARALTDWGAAGGRPRRLLLSGMESLTASERRIAELAADGLTNRQIADALFVTPRTVEGHLTQVFRKLEISGRRELPLATATGEPRRR